jgi:putative PIN family toxin of toxin-antitoxin system
MKVVLDTNILLVSLPKNSKYRIIFDNFLNKKFTLVISNDILTEYLEIMSVKINPEIATNIIELFLSSNNVEFQVIYYKWNLIDIDYDDNKFVDCFLAANVDYLVTNDKHFNTLSNIEFPNVNVLSIDQFIEILYSI